VGLNRRYGHVGPASLSPIARSAVKVPGVPCGSNVRISSCPNEPTPWRRPHPSAADIYQRKHGPGSFMLSSLTLLRRN
jgi:hypothetical protein